MAKKKSPNQALEKESIAAKDQPTILTAEWQDATAEKSRKRGWIYLDELPFLLAGDRAYDDLMPKLWTRYQLHLRGSKIPPYDTPGNRIEVWTKLFDRWAFGRVGRVPRTDSEWYSKLEAIPYIPLYRYDAKNGRLIEVEDRSDGSILYIVTLEDLRKYLTKIVEIPLPQALYPENESEEEEGPNQLPYEIPTPEPSPPLISQYALLRAGAHWKLTWDGEDIISKHSGWGYIHYLMLHPDQKFSNTELYKKVHPEIPAEGQAKIRGADDFENYTTGDFLNLVDEYPILDSETVLAIKKHLVSLKAEIDKTRSEGQDCEQLLEEKEKLEKALIESHHAGKLKTFSNDKSKLRQQLGKAIDRAIKNLPSSSHQHFKQALDPIFSDTKRYNPREKLSWKLQ